MQHLLRSEVTTFQVLPRFRETDQLHEQLDEEDVPHLTDLIVACSHGDVPAVEALLDQGANWRVSTSYGFNALTKAAQMGHREIVWVLLNRGVPADLKPPEGSTALIWACRDGRLDIAELLISAGADPNIMDGDSMTSLTCAAWADDLELVQFLVEHGANILPRQQHKDRSPVDLAAAENNGEVVEFLLRTLQGTAKRSAWQDAVATARSNKHKRLEQRLVQLGEEFFGSCR
jgi:ankyrin repeat protein